MKPAPESDSQGEILWTHKRRIWVFTREEEEVYIEEKMKVETNVQVEKETLQAGVS